MIRETPHLALFGRTARFPNAVNCGQFNIPKWQQLEDIFTGIFERRYYTNHGPLVQKLEADLAKFFNVKHAICMTNASIGLIIAAKALDLKGSIITPAWASPEAAQSLEWAGLEVHFCDIDKKTRQPSVDTVRAVFDSTVGGILGVPLWGLTDDFSELEVFAREKGIRLYFDAQYALGAYGDNHPIATIGELSVYSFHASHIINASDGGCVCTNSDLLAARLRNIRSSYGSGPAVDIPLTGNGRMSEAQAAMALLSLSDYKLNGTRNEGLLGLYRTRLADVPGVEFLNHKNSDRSGYCVVEIAKDEFGLSRDQLLKVLEAENVIAQRPFAPGLHRLPYHRKRLPNYVDALPNTDWICSRALRLPAGQQVTEEMVEEICDLVKLCHLNSKSIALKMA